MWDAHTHKRIPPVETLYPTRYFCPECDKEVTLIQKLRCFICSECRVVLVYR